MKQYHQLNFSINTEVLLEQLKNDHIFYLNKGKTHNEIIAWGTLQRITLPNGEYSETEIQTFIDTYSTEYIFCALSYDIKNLNTRRSLQAKYSKEQDDIELIVPEHVLLNNNGSLIYYGESIIPPEILNFKHLSLKSNQNNRVEIAPLTPSITKSEYLNNVDSILNRIQFGDIYEMNYCINFTGSYDVFDPVKNYINLHKNSVAPFSAFIKNKSKYILSASPERFVQKRGQELISQPIKGTAPRGKSEKDDERLMGELQNNPKEISENVMIVDLVRNDLSIIAERKSVQVPELCKLYTFDTVHQLISTVKGKIEPNVKFTSILNAMFPMGSMTGAPKVSAMNIIHESENFDRGLYAGAIGYISPNSNFDFNVVIRTLQVNTANKTLSASVGGAITIKSNPEDEYSECLLKLDVINKSLC